MKEHYDDSIRNWFLFCMIWSICCTTNEEGRTKFDTLIREKEGVFPIKDSVYEYYVDVANFGFANWEEKLKYGTLNQPQSCVC